MSTIPPPPLVVPRRIRVYANTSSLNTATYTFSGASLGPPAGDRAIIGISGHRDAGGSGRAITSVTVGGVSGAPVVEHAVGTAGANIFAAWVPSGTTGDVVITLAIGADHFGLILYAVYGLSSLVPAATATGTTSLSIPTRANGLVFAVAQDTSSMTVTGLQETSQVTVDAEFIAGGSSQFVPQNGSGVAVGIAGANVCVGCSFG